MTETARSPTRAEAARPASTGTTTTTHTDGTARGQVRVGTLVILVALVLVAAVAAGVLVGSAGLLERRAQWTGQSATRGVSDAVEVVDVVGTVDTADRNATRPDVTVRRSPGTGDVDPTQTTIDHTGDAVGRTVAHGSTATAAEYTTTVVDEAGTTDVLDDGDRCRVTIGVDGVRDDSDAVEPSEGGSTGLLVTAENGARTVVVANAPATISSSREVVRT